MNTNGKHQTSLNYTVGGSSEEDETASERWSKYTRTGCADIYSLILNVKMTVFCKASFPSNIWDVFIVYDNQNVLWIKMVFLVSVVLMLDKKCFSYM